MRLSEMVRLRDGLCIKGCGRPHKPRCQRCAICTNKAAEAQWRRRRTTTKLAVRGRPKKIRPVNLDTDLLIESHMKYAKCVAWRIAKRFDVDAADLVGDALYGLVVAGRTYDASYGVDFGAWASKRIRGAVFDGLRAWWRQNRVNEALEAA